MTDTKPWWQSKGVIGGAVAVVSAIAGLLGVSFDEGQLTESLLMIGAGVGGVLAIWGRVVADKQIG